MLYFGHNSSSPVLHIPCSCPLGQSWVLQWGNVLPDSGHSWLHNEDWSTLCCPSHGPLLQTSERGTWPSPDAHLMQTRARHSGQPVPSHDIGGRKQKSWCYCDLATSALAKHLHSTERPIKWDKAHISNCKLTVVPKLLDEHPTLRARHSPHLCKTLIRHS